MKLTHCGDRAVSIRFKEEISQSVHARVMAFLRAAEAASIEGVVELVPSYCALMLVYDPLVIGFHALKARLDALEVNYDAGDAQDARVVKLPVCYGGAFGPDLTHVAKHANLSEEEAVRLHALAEYPVYMLGFTPGFPYLGGMDARLNTPRLTTPRTRVEAGSVGIAGAQTGVYPVASPGGWQIIGRTPLKLYDPARENPFMLAAGQRLKFVPISAENYEKIAGGELQWSIS